MRKIFTISIIILFLFSCANHKNTLSTEYKETITIEKDGDASFSIFFNKGREHNHPTLAIWTEDNNGNYLKTLYVTQSYASGVFGYQAYADGTWVNKRGSSYQPAALPYWSYKKGLIDGEYIVPDIKHPFVDAYSGATPKSDFAINTKMIPGNYRLFVEINQAWDWNEFWVNAKYTNLSYKNVGQPSLIYSVEINEVDSVYFLNPIGHGNPIGENGKLYTDLSTITTAKDIFSQIKVLIKK